MAERRMFAKTIVLSDAFLDMPLGARCLYMTMGMLADDDGFVNNPKSIMRQSGSSEDDLKILIAKKFIIPFESGVIVIKHWRINNYLQKDRYNETKYLEEKSTLQIDEKGAYTSNVYTDSVYTGKDRLGKDRLDNSISEPKPRKHKYGEYKHVLLTDEEMEKLKHDYPQVHIPGVIKQLDEGIELKGYKYKNHYLALRKWIEKDYKQFTQNVDIEPVYTATNNPMVNIERLEEIMLKRGRNT